VFLLVFDSLVGFMLYTRLLESASAPLVSTYAYVTPLVGAVIGATVLDEALWAGAFVGGALVLGAVALELRGPMGPRPSRRKNSSTSTLPARDLSQINGPATPPDTPLEPDTTQAVPGCRPQPGCRTGLPGRHYRAETHEITPAPIRRSGVVLRGHRVRRGQLLVALNDQPDGLTGEMNQHRWGPWWAQPPGLNPTSGGARWPPRPHLLSWSQVRRCSPIPSDWR
jgi:hypothetical protein